jgi:hypothetical protein
VAKFCALCLTPIADEAQREPFGKDGALVDVCSTCCDEHPRSGRYSFSNEHARLDDRGTGPGNKPRKIGKST